MRSTLEQPCLTLVLSQINMYGKWFYFVVATIYRGIARREQQIGYAAELKQMRPNQTSRVRQVVPPSYRGSAAGRRESRWQGCGPAQKPSRITFV